MSKQNRRQRSCAKLFLEGVALILVTGHPSAHAMLTTTRPDPVFHTKDRQSWLGKSRLISCISPPIPCTNREKANSGCSWGLRLDSFAIVTGREIKDLNIHLSWVSLHELEPENSTLSSTILLFSLFFVHRSSGTRGGEKKRSSRFHPTLTQISRRINRTAHL